MHTVLLVIHILVTAMLIGIILLQRSDGDGLGGLGGGGGNTVFSGRGKANFLTRTTAILATVFMLSSLALSLFAPHEKQSVLDAMPAEGAVEAPATQVPAVPKPE